MSQEAPITFTLDGQAVSAQAGDSIWQAAKRQGIEIPHLCHSEGLRADGNCRACVVEIKGERALSASCCRQATQGLEVLLQTERVQHSQKMVIELLLSDMPDAGHKWSSQDVGTQPAPADQHGELSHWARALEVKVRPELHALRREQPAPDVSHPAMAVNLDACIQCRRCVRACREEQVNDVLGYAFRGAHSEVVFDLNDPMGLSTCVACGECVQACPTGALMPKTHQGDQVVDKKVDSVCPYCGVGCLMTYHVKDNRIVSVEGRDGPANQGRLCVKGRFGFDYAHNPQRLTRPLIRKAGVPKDPEQLNRLNRDPSHWQDVFREATWEEALDLAALPLKTLRDTYGKKSLAGFGSAKGSNEEAYLFQKLVRTGFGSNNVDHCTRLCHASSVAALLEGVGSGAVTNQVNDVAHADLVLVIGSNPTSNHPVAATWMKNAAKRGTRIVVADPRGTDLARHAWRVLHFKADTDVAMLNAMIHVIIEEGLVDAQFVQTRTRNYEAIRDGVKAFTPERMAPICGIEAETLREVARAFAKAKSAMILWGMGVSQHVHGTDNVRALIALSMITGQVGKEGAGLHPLRGQNNVQGASDAGLIPMMFPNYQRVSDPKAHAWFESFWGTPLDDQPGYTVVELMGKVLAEDSDPHKIRGMYIMGIKPASLAPCTLFWPRSGCSPEPGLPTCPVMDASAIRQRTLSVPCTCWLTPMPHKIMALFAVAKARATSRNAPASMPQMGAMASGL
ncbi:MAG: Tungsten-containing formate dehydrogenase alpha subunit [Pseudomonadota bacterium]